MANIDEVVKKNKQYLTQAQIDALIAASNEYNIQNAAKRANALASAREQYDTGYRGLQNIGLAGNPDAAPISGEVPRLAGQVRNPFDDYNRRLGDVENRRLNALGGAFAEQTRATRAAEAARRAAASEAERQRVAQQQELIRQRQAEVQRAEAAARATNSKALPSAPRLNPKDLTTPSVKEFATPSQAELAAEKYQRDGMALTDKAKTVAAASLYNITTAVNAAQERGEKLTQKLKTASAQPTPATKQPLPSLGQEHTVKEGSTAQATATKRPIPPLNREETVKDPAEPTRYYVNDQGEAKAHTTSTRARAQYEEAQRNLENLQWRRHYGDTVSDEEYQTAIDTRDITKAIAESPELSNAFDGRYSASEEERRKANAVISDFFADQVTTSMGYTRPKMSDAEFRELAKDIPQIRRSLRVIDGERNRPVNEPGTDVDQDNIDSELDELKKLGYTEDEAREALTTFDGDRHAKRDYDTYQKAYAAYFMHDGEKPSGSVMTNETDPTYRAVNNLPDLEVQRVNELQMEHPQLADYEKLWTPQERAHGDVEYMTQEQRDAYNAIYETEGIDAANQYAEDIKPLVEMKRAQDDRAYLEKLASEHKVQAWMLARATNLITNVPAMLEKLYVSTSNQISEVTTGGSEVPMRYSPDSTLSRGSNWADIIQSKQSEDIIEHYKDEEKETLGKVVNFLYGTGTSMADSAMAMLISGMAGSWATDVMFFSSAGNQAYKDAIARGGTQEQALAFSYLSGIAEALFEHASIEHFMNLDHKGKLALLKNLASQSGVEASEEVFTEAANLIADAVTMRDKSALNQQIDSLMRAGVPKEEAQRTALLDSLKDIGMAGLGGFASGLGFGAIGTATSAVRSAAQSATGKVIDAAQVNSIGKSVKEYGDVEQMKNTGVLLGGESLTAAESVEKRQSNKNVGDLTVAVQKELSDLEATTDDQKVAVTRILDGGKMTVKEAESVLTTLGTDTVQKMGYDTNSAIEFANSYNERIEQHGVTSRAETMAKTAEKRFNKAKQSAAKRVWANPEQGLSYTTPEGVTVKPMPGNLTAVGLAEQERTGFKTRATATKGNVTYAVAGMQAREGLSNERTYAEIQKGFTKEARKKAQIYEELADALGVKMVIHDVMVGTNGFIDEKGNMHVVLSGKQSVLRVAAHELTHFMKEHAGTEYASMREYLIGEVGQAKFDKLVKQKAKEYGLNLDTEKGRIVADDEVCAELCERMLSNEDSLTRFAEKDTKAAKTLKAHLLEILHAIKSAFKQAENRDFGASKSELIESQETLESWITGLQKAIENAETKAETDADEARAKQFQANEALYITEEDAKASRAQAKIQSEVEADLKRGTSVSGYDTDTINGIIRSTLDTVGGETVLSKDALKQARARIAQTVRTAEAFLLDTENDAKQQALNDRTRQVATEIVDAYQATEGENAGALAELKDFLIGSDKTLVIGIGPNQMADIRSQYESPMVLQGKLSKALGARVQLVGKTNAKYESAWKMDELYEQLREKYNLSDDQSFTSDAQNLVDFIDGIRQQDEGVTAGIGDSETREQAILDVQQSLLDQVLKAAGAKTGVEFSLDMDELRDNAAISAQKTAESGGARNSIDTDYMRLAEKQKAGTLSNEEEKDLRNMVNEAAKAAMPNTKIVDKKGNPLLVHHGTKAEFTVFNTKEKGGQNGTAEGFGIYLTDSTDVSKAYGNRQIDAYANITRPAYGFKKTIKKPELVRILKASCEQEARQMVDEDEYDSVKEALRDTWISNYVNTYDQPSMAAAYSIVADDILHQNSNDANIVYEVMSGMGIREYGPAMDFYHDILTPTTGIDGIWQIWTGANGQKSNVYLAFSSEQVKSADLVTYDDKGNIIPLSERFNPKKEDIRYSLDDDYMDLAQRYTDGDINPTDLKRLQDMVTGRANAVRAKIFAATDVPTYRIRRGATPSRTIKVYKTFTLTKEGEPSALFVSSQHALPVGVWLDAQDTFHFTDQKNGHMYVPSTKNPNTKGGATGRMTSLKNISKEDRDELERLGYITRGQNGEYTAKNIVSLAYRPGWHAGDLPFFPQGGMKVEGSNYENVHRYNQVVFECEMDMGEDFTSYDITDDGKVKYKDMQQMPTGGGYKFATNPMANAQDIGAWYISDSLKIVRALSEEEANAILASEGRAPQEWQAYQDDAELKAIKGDKAKAAYEKRMGPLDLDRLGYDPTRTAEDMKLPDLVTYDDDGNIIPLSQRFNASIKDPRYDLDTETLREIQPQTIEQQVWGGNVRYSVDTPIRRASASKPEKPKKKPGMKPAGRDPRAREVDVPERAKTGDPVSDWVRSFLESDKASDDIVNELMDKVRNGEWGTYKQLTNEEAMDRAKGYIARKQFTEAQQDFHAMVASGRYNVHTRALGLQLLTEAANRGDKAAVLNIAADLRQLATDAGQSLQILSVLKSLGGVGAGWYMQKEIDRLNNQYADEIASGKMDEITVDPELMQNLIQAKTQAEIEAAEDAIAEQIAAQLPLTTKSKIVNWRYLAMLGNPTTHFRNLTGNVFMAGLNAAKDVVAVGAQRAAEKVGLSSKEDRAHAVLTKKDRQTWKDVAAQSFAEQERNLRGSGKNGFGSFIQRHMRSFDNKVLNAIAQGSKTGKNTLTKNGIMGMLEVEDVWFLRPAYQNAFMQYMKAQGFSVQDGVVGKEKNGEFTEITDEQMSKAVDWASQQAWKATFRDASTIASILNNASQRLGPVGHVLIEGVLPFKKTPVNIAKRGIEYSPVGVIMGTVQLLKDVKKGKVTAAQAIDNLASGLVGTSLMLMGMFLAKLGALRAGGEDKKKQETYLQDTGDQTYSLKLGDVSLGISALAPAAIPLLMGAALYDKLSSDGDEIDLSSIAETVAGTLDPFMEMSVVSSLNSALKNYNQNGIGGALGNTIMTALQSYGGQFLPTVVGKVGQFADPTVRTTKSSAASPLGSNLDYYGRSLAKKVPGLEATLQPDVNVWGRTTKKDGFAAWALDFANKFLLPVNVKISNKDAVDDELIRLVESTANVDILPSDGPKKFTVKGKDYPMTAKQYTEYSQDRGVASYAAIKEVMGSAAYKSASDEEKADMIQNALTTAQKQVNTVWKEKLGALDATEPQEGVKGIHGDYSDPGLYKVAASYPNAYDKAAKAKSKGVSPDTFLTLYDKKETYVGDDRADYMRREIMSSNLTPQQKELMDDLIISDKGSNPDYSSQAWFEVSMLGKTQYDKAKTGAKVGVTPDVYLQAYRKDKEIDAAKLGKNKKKAVTTYLDGLSISAPAYDYLLAQVFGYSSR